MRSSSVVVNAPVLDDHLSPLQAIEDLAIQAFVSELCSVIPASLQADAILLPCPCITSKADQMTLNVGDVAIAAFVLAASNPHGPPRSLEVRHHLRSYSIKGVEISSVRKGQVCPVQGSNANNNGCEELRDTPLSINSDFAILVSCKKNIRNSLTKNIQLDSKRT